MLSDFFYFIAIFLHPLFKFEFLDFHFDNPYRKKNLIKYITDALEKECLIIANKSIVTQSIVTDSNPNSNPNTNSGTLSNVTNTPGSKRKNFSRYIQKAKSNRMDEPLNATSKKIKKEI